MQNSGKEPKTQAENSNAIKQLCIIGCGSSGAPVVKAMVDRGILFDCFEKSDCIGGNWVVNNRNGMSSTYDSLVSNTSCDAMQYEDYPMPSDYPDYPGHRLVTQYLEHYFSEFKLHQYVTFNTGVKHCTKNDAGQWQVTLENDTTRLYENLIVANGHHWDPYWPKPTFPGAFDGLIMHAHSYLNPFDPVDMQDKNVIVVGMGNSAVDIACELSGAGVAKNVYLSVRTGQRVLPRYLWGKAVGGKNNNPLPWQVQTRLLDLLVKIAVGSPQKHGLPKPQHSSLQSHPTISQHLYQRIDDGAITPKPNLKTLKGSTVEFTDGSTAQADIIIYATGYQVTFPFFDEDFISAHDNDLPLWERMVMPSEDNLYFVGLLQPLGAIMPLAEQQAKLLADLFIGKLSFPSPNEMLISMRKEREAMFKRYAHSKRHTMQVDTKDYLEKLDVLRHLNSVTSLSAEPTSPPPPGKAKSPLSKPSADHQEKALKPKNESIKSHEPA